LWWVRNLPRNHTKGKGRRNRNGRKREPGAFRTKTKQLTTSPTAAKKREREPQRITFGGEKEKTTEPGWKVQAKKERGRKNNRGGADILVPLKKKKGTSGHAKPKRAAKEGNEGGQGFILQTTSLW